jgi:chromosome segregation and condensation protein ScpB
VAEIAQATGTTETVVVGCLARLERALAERPTAMGLFVREKAGQRAFILDLKTAFRADVAAVAPPLLKPAVTETLALIAINQPLPQARLVRERGSTVYEHVKELLDRGLIARSRKGRNFHLRTTDAFAAEFGLDNDPELIRRALARAAGITGTPEVVGSPRLHWDGVGTPEGAEPRDVNALAAGLVAEAREFVPPPAPPSPPKPAVESVADIIAAEAARIAAGPAPVAPVAASRENATVFVIFSSE